MSRVFTLSGEPFGPVEWFLSSNTKHGIRVVNVNGVNDDIDSLVTEDIWTGGGTWVPPTVPRVHDIVSGSALDTDAGLGAQTVRIYGLDQNYKMLEEVVTLNGTSNVATAGTYSMIYRMVVETVGTTETNQGAITATAQTDLTVTEQIVAGKGRSQSAFIQVPIKNIGLLVNYNVSMVREPNVNTGLIVSLENDQGFANVELMMKPWMGAWQVLQNVGIQINGTSYSNHDFVSPPFLTERSIVKLRATSSDVNAQLTGGFAVVFIDYEKHPHILKVT